MRLKNIIIAISATMLACTACVEESMMTPPSGNDGMPTTLNIRFAPEATITKAATELGYTYAEADEIVVNSVALAIFNKTTGALVGCKYATFTEWSGQLSDNKPYYEITGISALTGNVNFLAIANSTIITSQALLETAVAGGQAAFENYCVENNNGPVFDATKLVKFGKLNVPNLSPTNNNTIIIPLTQLAARVDVGITVNNTDYDTNWNFFITKYSITNGINSKSDVFLPEYSSSYTYNSKTALGSINAVGSLDDKAIKFNFYTYERATSSNPVKIAIDGYLVDKNNTDIKEAKSYELSLNPTTPSSLTNGLVHGYFYDVTGNITPTTMKIEFTTKVKPWSEITVPIGANIKEIHFLVVKETMVYMPNISVYFDDYRSDSPITISNKKATYTNYVLSGNKVVAQPNTSCTGSQVPSITVVGNQIKISSILPANFFPKDISFTVTNEAGLTENVTVRQYPAYYLTGEESKGGGPILSGDSPDLSTNPNIFTLTVIDSGSLPNGLKVGNPTGSDGQTLNTEEANNMVSPKFMVASRQAVVSSGYYTSNMAIARCATYWETLDATKTGVNATYPPGTWRMPTLAELEFLGTIQKASSSVKYLFNDDSQNAKYWSALPAWFYNFYESKRDKVANANTVLTNPSSGGARCVRDIY